jgi:hypothetical protein
MRLASLLRGLTPEILEVGHNYHTCPRIGKRAVDNLKVPPSAHESTQYVGARNIVAALLHSPGDATESQLRRRQAQKNNLDTVPNGLPTLQPTQMNEPAHRRLEGKIDPEFRQTTQFCEEYASGRHRG